MNMEDVKKEMSNSEITDFKSAIKKYILYIFEDTLQDEMEFNKNCSIDLGTDEFHELNFKRFVDLISSKVEAEINDLVYQQIIINYNENQLER